MWIKLFLIEIDVALAVSGALAVPLSIVGMVIGTVAIWAAWSGDTGGVALFEGKMVILMPWIALVQIGKGHGKHHGKQEDSQKVHFCIIIY